MTLASGAALRVVSTGWATTVQDHGRVGLAHLGVATAGPTDRRGHDLVNRLVGNPPDSATLETLGGLVVEATRPAIVARSTDGTRHTLAAGERLQVDTPTGRVWAYLAVRGGVDVPLVLGSRSHDTLSGLGPPPIRAGDVLDVGADPATDLTTELAPERRVDHPVRLWQGPQHDWFLGGLRALTERRWNVTNDVSRVGVRLESRPFERTARSVDQMPSVGLVEGAVQITPAGEPIVMLANHPTTGGYPVIGVVDPDDVSYVAQSPPGATLRFVPAR